MEEYQRQLWKELWKNSTRQSTARNYYGIWKNFSKFMLKLDKKPKSWERRIALYGAYLTDKGIQSSTLKSYFSAIKKILWEDGYNLNDSKMLLHSITKACRLVNDTVQTRLPIKCSLLEMILFEIDRIYSNQVYLAILFKTLIAIAFYGLFRIGELTASQHALKACNVNLGINKDKILFILESSKTHNKESRPQKIKISKLPDCQAAIRYFCPFKLFTKYLKMRGTGYLDKYKQFFIFRDRSPVKPSHVRGILDQAIKNIGLDHRLYCFHSLRMWMATQLIKMGYTIEVVKCIGRWTSNVAYKYIKQ